VWAFHITLPCRMSGPRGNRVIEEWIKFLIEEYDSSLLLHQLSCAPVNSCSNNEYFSVFGIITCTCDGPFLGL